jgi:nucleoid-associated protein YgaU
VAADSDTSAGQADQPPSGEPDAVTVETGDTLWSIAADRLPPDSTDSDIDNAWRAWYSANTQVIGDNPDLILPGQLLLPPDSEIGR